MIDDINYELNEDEFTAQVIKKEDGYMGKVVVPEMVRYNNADYTDGPWNSFH